MDEVKRPLIALVSILVIAASVISIYLTQRRPTPKINMKPFEAVGEVTAEETVKLLSGRGRVLVIAYDADVPAMKAPIDFFQNSLKSSPGITIAATETIKMDPMEAYGPEMMGLSADKFFELVSKHSGVDAIVSFVGAPYFQDKDWSRLKQGLPKLVAVSTFGLQVKQLLQQRVVQVAIVPRFTPPEQPDKEPTTRREWFDKFYMVVTPENAAQLPG